MPLIKLYEGDCLEIMPTLLDKSIDMILCDLPYGTTACKWDTIIPFEPLWKEYKRLIKDNGAIVLTASQPFTSALVMSNPGWFKYEWIWEKDKPSNFALANKQAMKYHENILVFSPRTPKYNKQITYGHKPMNAQAIYGRTFHGSVPSLNVSERYIGGKTERNPSSIIKVNTVKHNSADSSGLHPTQKPVALFEYLILTYSNEGDTVLDNCAGSGTTGVACLNTKREGILIEKDVKYCEIIRQRLEQHQRQKVLSL